MLSDDLLELQRLDTLADQLRHRRAHLAERPAAEAATAALGDLRRRLAELAARDTELTDAIAALEHESEELTTHRQRLEGQLKTVIAPREAEALMHEIATLTTRRDELDELELEHLEEQSTNADERAALEGEAPERQRVADGAAALLAGAEALVDDELTADAAARAEISAGLDAGLRDDYERRRQRYGGVAVARLDGKRCGGCHLDLSAGELDQVKATPPGEWTDCPECGRMLVP